MRVRLSSPLLLFACFGLLHAGAFAQTRIEPVEGGGTFTIEDPGVTDLSGMTWTAGDRFWAVSDKRKALVPVTLQVDAESGRITWGEIGAPVPVESSLSDFEGIAWVPKQQRLYVSGEGGQGLRSFTTAGVPGPRVGLAAIFAHCRRNLSLESLTYDVGKRCFWTANEEALPEDGPVASPTEGSPVRLHCCDESGKALRQYAWRTEPAPMRFGGAGSGVSDLCALPNGDLLVLERGFGRLGLQCRIYRADLREATDTRLVKGLAAPDAKFTAATKVPLFQQATAFTNYEGMTLGPALANGWRSLILIADSNGASQHSFLALRVRWDAPRAKP